MEVLFQHAQRLPGTKLKMTLYLYEGDGGALLREAEQEARQADDAAVSAVEGGGCV